jgi:hypothetical protein
MSYEQSVINNYSIVVST